MIRRFQRWLSGFLGISSTEAEEICPETILGKHEEFYRARIGKFDQALAPQVALCELLREQIRELEVERKHLQTALDAQAKAPTAEAPGLALKWDVCARELAELQEQLLAAQTGCSHLASERDQVIGEARLKLAELEESLGKERIARALVRLQSGSGSQPPGRI
jgi:chromosome segregation ATPase